MSTNILPQLEFDFRIDSFFSLRALFSSSSLRWRHLSSSFGPGICLLFWHQFHYSISYVSTLVPKMVGHGRLIHTKQITVVQTSCSADEHPMISLVIFHLYFFLFFLDKLCTADDNIGGRRCRCWIHPIRRNGYINIIMMDLLHEFYIVALILAKRFLFWCAGSFCVLLC